MKTALQELILKLPNEFIFDNPIIIYDALKKEKEQIEEAFRKGGHFQAFGGSNVDTYYTETYKTQTP